MMILTLVITAYVIIVHFHKEKQANIKPDTFSFMILLKITFIDILLNI